MITAGCISTIYPEEGFTSYNGGVVSHGACLYIEYECSTQHVITLVFHYQCHSIGSSIARDYASNILPCHSHHIRDSFSINTLIISFDCCYTSIDYWKGALFQNWYCVWDSGYYRISQFHRSHDRGNYIGVYRIQCRWNYYSVTPSLGRRDQWRYDMLITFKIIIVRTIADTVNNCIEYGIFHYQMQSRDTVTPRSIQVYTISIVTCGIIFFTRYRPHIWQIVWTDSCSDSISISWIIHSQRQGDNAIASIHIRNLFGISTSTKVFFSIPQKFFTSTNHCYRIWSCYTRSNWENVIRLIFFTTNIGYY